MNIRKTVAVLLAGIIASLNGCGNAPSPGQNQAGPVVYVDVEIAREAPINATVTATGTINAKNEVKIIAQAEGKIIFLGVEEGDKVKEGQTVVRLDASVLAAQTKEAEANAQDAKANYDRLNRLMKSGLIAEQEFEQAKTRHNVLKARLEYQKALLEYTTIRSPISGIVTFRGVREGDVAVPRAHLLTISDPATLVIEINVSELEVPRIKPGDRVTIKIDAYPNQDFTGMVRRVFPSSDPLTRLVKVEIQLTDRDDRLFPGLFARAVLTSSRKDRATVLSSDAIITAPSGGNSAFVVVDSVVEKRDLKLGIREGNRVEILEGVAAGEKVVVAGKNTLNPGMVVHITRER